MYWTIFINFVQKLTNYKAAWIISYKVSMTGVIYNFYLFLLKSILLPRMAHIGDYFWADSLESNFLTAQNLRINISDEFVEGTFSSREHHEKCRWLWKKKYITQ